jgi:hypothetical protein
VEVYSVNLSKVATALTLSLALVGTLAAAPQGTKSSTPSSTPPAKSSAAKPETVKPADLPKPVTDAVMKAHPKGEITTATKSMKGSDTVYTVSVKDAGKTSKMMLTADGKTVPAAKSKGK